MAIGAIETDSPAVPARPPLWREVVVGLAVFGCYALVAAMHWPARVGLADRNSIDLYALERRLHLDMERPLNLWLAARPFLRVLANYEYAISYILIAFGVLFWLYFRRPAAYRWARTSFILLNLIAITCFLVYPLTPPRMLPQLGFIDTVRMGHTVGSWGSPLVTGANQLAAMPSLHIGWSLWASVILAYVGAGLLAQAASAFHVVLTTYVIMATANHYLLDAIAGLLAVWLACALLSLFSDRPGYRGGPRVAPSDAFFLYVESRRAPQQVGGLIMLDGTATGTVPGADGVPHLDGVPGADGVPDLDGVPGADGVPHLDGVPGADGVPHLDGRPGPGAGSGPGADVAAMASVTGPDGIPGPERIGAMGSGPGPADLDVSRLPTQASVRALIRSRLTRLPRFRQRVAVRSRWRRPRWAPVSELDIDWNWHLPVRDLTGPDGRPGGETALHALVAEITATPLPRDRPLWRFFIVHGVAPGRAAGVLIMHHVVADGIGTVAQAVKLLEPQPPLPVLDHERMPGRLRIAGATAVGLVQLATGGMPAYRLAGAGHPDRRYATADVPLDAVRTVAHRYGTRVSDVLMSCVAGALPRVRPDLAGVQLRTAVPLTVREPGTADEGNLTAAVMIDLPLDRTAERARLAEVSRRSAPLMSSGRALAARFVMDAAGTVLPPPAHAWFARTVYGGRFFQSIVSNMPGSPVAVALTGTPISAAYPILPLAPGTPLAVGGLSWDGMYHLGISAEPALLPDVQAFATAVCAVFADLCADAPPTVLLRSADSP